MDVPYASFDTAGIEVTRPEHPYRQIVEFMQGEGFHIIKHVSKNLLSPQVRAADLIVCMTHDIAERTQTAVGESFAGKVVVLNEAVGFGMSRKEEDIPALAEGSIKSIRSLYSQLKAATGRMVRMIQEGDTAEDFGAEIAVGTSSNGHLDDPQFRQFASRYIVEFVERAFEPPTTQQIADAMDVLGRPVSVLEIEELALSDLKRHLKKQSGHWHRIEAEKPKDREAPGGSPPPRSRQRTGQSTSGPNGGGQSRSRTVRKAMSVDEALDVLGLRSGASMDDAQKAFRKIQQRYHPDKFHDDDEFRSLAEEKVKAVNAAMAVLKDKLNGGE